MQDLRFKISDPRFQSQVLRLQIPDGSIARSWFGGNDGSGLLDLLAQPHARHMPVSVALLENEVVVRRCRGIFKDHMSKGACRIRREREVFDLDVHAGGRGSGWLPPC